MSKVTLRTMGKRYECVVEQTDDHIIFRKAPFKFKNEIKAMKGARWYPDNKHWRVKNCARNHFQLTAMMVELEGQPVESNPYDWFERPLDAIEAGDRPLYPHQLEMIAKCLTYRYQILAADMGLGKSVTAIEIMERLDSMYGWGEDFGDKCWFVGPTSALESVWIDVDRWGSDIKPKFMTYERLTIDHQSLPTPQAIIFDECTGLKTPSAQRTLAAQSVADAVREAHGTDGCVILMSGSPTAKRPSDIWAQAEIAWPGFLREGSLKAFEERYAIVVDGEDSDGNKFKKIDGWRDEEVSQIPDRLDGLMSVYRKDDILNLPPRTFTRVTCQVTAKIKRVAKALVDSAPNVITALTRLRSLSSGFQYKDGEAGEGGDRAMVETACPKDQVLRDYLSREESRGRMIVGASFQGSVDRVRRICQAEGWDTLTVDGRGWNTYTAAGEHLRQVEVLDAWKNNSNKTVLVGNPASCRFGLTLVEAKTIVVYDQNFSAEHRLQFLDRNYRIGQDEAVEVIDVLHLPVDELILDTLTENRRLEELSLGLIADILGS